MKRIIILISIFTISCVDIESEIDGIYKQADSLIGKRVVINGDTLMVIDFSLINNNFTLSNDIKVNEKVIKNNLID